MARKAWDQIAPNYDQEIVSPLSQGVENPLFSTLKKIPKKSTKVVADLGCGTGNLLPTLATQFKSVHAVDFSKEMLLMAKKRAEPYKNITYHRQNMERLKLPKIQFDVAITVNSLLMPSQRGLRRAIKNIHSVLKPEGFFLGVMPAMEGFIYQGMLIYEQELRRSPTERSAYKKTQIRLDSDTLNFELGLYTEGNLTQKFFYQFELLHRLQEVGFKNIKMNKVLYPWDANVLKDYELFHNKPEMWDWFVSATK